MLVSDNCELINYFLCEFSLAGSNVFELGNVWTVAGLMFLELICYVDVELFHEACRCLQCRD